MLGLLLYFIILRLHIISININLFWLPGKLSKLISDYYLVDYGPVIRFF
jgi:hypothetical protein